MKFWNALRKIERIRFYISLLLVGLLFVVLSGIVISRPKAELVSADGVIERIESYEGADGETQYRVFISYTDADGNRHEGLEYPAYSSSMKEGGTVGVQYDPASPEMIQSSDGAFIPYLILAVGLIAIAAAIIKMVQDSKKVPGDSPFETVQKPVDPIIAEQVGNSDEPTKEYYFHWTGKLNQSYVLETPSRVAVYEAVCDKIGVLKPYRYTFTDRRTGVSREHEVTHTNTTRYGDGTGHTSFSVVSSSGFKIDGRDNWAYLSDMGYSVVPERSGIKLNFSVRHGGVPVAYLEAAGVNILSDDAKNPLGDKLPATGLYKVSCRDADLEAVFVACFCVSRVEFF